jgi:hypothetical protein
VAARSASTAAERRLQLVGGEAAALLLAFLLLTAFTIRRGLTAEWERLERRGARRSQLWLFALTESAAVTLPGVAVGWLLAVVSTAVIAHWASLPVRATLSDSLLTWPAAGLALAGWAIATLVLLAALRPPAVVRVGPLQAADLLAAGALAALLLAAGRSSSTAALAAEPDPLLAMLPVLVALLAALLIGRLLPPLLRLAGRRSGGLPLAGRLAVITLARAPGRAAAAAAFLVVSLGLALFAASYRQTLVQGQRDQADFAVPVAAIASSGARLVPPLEAAPAARFAALPGIGQALPVDRIPATAPSSGGPPAAVDVIGVPPGGLDSISWRERPTGAQGDLSAGQARLRGVPLPAGARRLSMRVQPAGRVDVSLSLRTPAGGFVSVSLTGPAAELAAPIPAAAQGGQLIALRVTRRAAGALSEEHQGAEGSGSTGQAGALRLRTAALGCRQCHRMAGLRGPRSPGLAARRRRWRGCPVCAGRRHRRRAAAGPGHRRPADPGDRVARPGGAGGRRPGAAEPPRPPAGGPDRRGGRAVPDGAGRPRVRRRRRHHARDGAERRCPGDGGALGGMACRCRGRRPGTGTSGAAVRRARRPGARRGAAAAGGRSAGPRRRDHAAGRGGSGHGTGDRRPAADHAGRRHG